MIGFALELASFMMMPAMAHSDYAQMQQTMYDCADIPCSDRPDFVVFELMMRMFVGSTIFNNIVLLYTILFDQMHIETSLLKIFKSMNACIWILFFLFIGMDLRVQDYDTSEWNTLFELVNWLQIGIHVTGCAVLWAMVCCRCQSSSQGNCSQSLVTLLFLCQLSSIPTKHVQ